MKNVINLLILSLSSFSSLRAGPLSETEVAKRAKKVKVLIVNLEGVVVNRVKIGNEDKEDTYEIALRDQAAINRAHDAGLQIVFITSSNSPQLVRWAEKQGVYGVFTNIATMRDFVGVKDRVKEALVKVGWKPMLTDADLAYMGSETDQIAALKMGGIAACPQDAHVRVKEVCSYTTPSKGGEGALNDLVDFIITAQKAK